MFSRKDMPLTMFLIGACAVNFIAYLLELTSEDGWGYYYASEIWEGAYWAYITSCFVHYDFVHIGFNLYWLYILGSVLEKEIGTLKLLLIVLVSAIVTSGFEFIVSEDTGIGISGVLYCFVGLMWGLKAKYSTFQQLLTKQLFTSFLGWLVLCWVLSIVEVMSIGNAAHISGLVFGIMVSKLFFKGRYRLAWVAGQTILLTISIVPLFWFPTSNLWVCSKAYAAYEKEEYEISIEWLTKAIELDPHDAWAYDLRAYAYRELDQESLSASDWMKARELDPSLREEDE